MQILLKAQLLFIKIEQTLERYVYYFLQLIFRRSIFNYFFLIFIRRYFKKKYGIISSPVPRLFWGAVPLINYKYFSAAMQAAGFKSDTVVTHHYSVYQKADFNIYVDDILKDYKLNSNLKIHFKPWLLLDYALKNYDIFHISYEGLFLNNTNFWNLEAQIIHDCNKKIVLMPYGGDTFMYSKIKSSSQQHAMLINYPDAARNEKVIYKRFAYWQEHADFCLGGGMIDGFGRWDSLSANFLSVDINNWMSKSSYSSFDGINGAVKIVHSPNHRGVKGTEFIIKAINDLNDEGLQVKLVLLENRTNEDVKKILLEEADILLEQLIMTGYGLSAIEGLATGIPVISNLEDINFNLLFSRYSFLGECPIVSASPESVKEVLRKLVKDPELRKNLGKASLLYAGKYHSSQTTKYLFNKIYEKIWHNIDVDMINLYHPLLPDSYNNQSEQIRHPLVKNKIVS